ncbi:SRPBCC family protein [Nocardia huaxiensis]|uniref:SRPBCC family protein n=1 Tax=Nocardia huaxiensis TaxID=2755382 RepID=UPI001E3EFC0A|nr:SRPBCC family protein [Nocardia huaxiensis]UFS98509.1 SRPBCC family protein [Nocardia huaxiensis]
MPGQPPSVAASDKQVTEPVLEDGIEIDAPIDRVWALVKDVRRMPDWSPQVRSTRLRSGYLEIASGAQFTSLNSEAGLDWKTHGEIVRCTAERELAFRIEENWVIWSFLLERTESGGTRLTQRRETPDGISPLSKKLTETYLGGYEAFTASMRAGMRQTLENIKAEAERGGSI